VCLLTDIDGYGEQQPVAQSGLALRLNGVIGAALKSAGVASSETWRQERVSRQLALLPVAADAATVVPLLARGLVAELDKDRTAADGPPLRVRAAITRDAVTQVKGSYVGRAVVTATRLLDSPAVRAELSGDPAAVLALIVSDGAYQDVLTRGSSDFPFDEFRRVSVDVPEHGWQGTGWVRACAPGSLKPLPKRIGKVIRDNILPVLAAGSDDAVSFLDAATGTTGGTGSDELTTAAHHLMAGHASADHAGAADHSSADHGSHAVSGHSTAETAYVVDVTHTYAYDNNGYIQEYGTHSVYDGAAYDDHGYDSSGDHHGGVA
jgi:hypothetical protein